MHKHNQNGAISGVVISLILTVILLLGAMGFGTWAYTQMQDYKNNVDDKVQVAVESAVAKESSLKDKQFAEQSKLPLRVYKGPDAYGSIAVSFPKTWSAYVDAAGKSSQGLVDGYFAPLSVPSIQDPNSVFALRVQVIDQTYAATLKNLTSQQRYGLLKISAYHLPKMPKIVGIKIVGQINNGVSGSQKNVTMIVCHFDRRLYRFRLRELNTSTTSTKIFCPTSSFRRRTSAS